MAGRNTVEVRASRPERGAVARKVGGRSGLLALGVASSLGLAGSVVIGAMATTFVDGPNLQVAVDVVTDRTPATKLPGGDLSFDRVQLFAPAQYDVQLIEAIGVGLPYVVFGATCVLLLILVRRLWTGRSFTRFAVWSLGVVGLLTIASGMFSRWLPQLATEIALSRLGLPQTYDEGMAATGTGEWFGAVSANGVLDYPGIGLGVVLLLMAVLVHRGRALQESADGLV
ncbi:hypothetical protein [Arthrobacter sp.]|uniref:hypothetical protein n=1 Tax=Arthrobacter sp. TaxID=1667 RepID=UPI003A8F04C7